MTSFTIADTLMATAEKSGSDALDNSGVLSVTAMAFADAASSACFCDDDPQPIPMILTCPSCGGRHVDEAEFATRSHHTHACQHCGMVWRPAIVPTVGVQFLPGFKNA